MKRRRRNVQKTLTLVIVVLIFNLLIAPPVYAADTLTKEAKNAAKLKARIVKLGTRKDPRVKVTLKDGTKLKGQVSEIGENSFTLTDPETGTSTTVPYANAKQVLGNGLTENQIWFITVGAMIAVVVITAIVKSNTSDKLGSGFPR